MDKLEQAESVRSEEEQKAEEKPLVFSEYIWNETVLDVLNSSHIKFDYYFN